MDNDEFGMIPQEQRERILHAFSTLTESIRNIISELAAELGPVLRRIIAVIAERLTQPPDDLLRDYASSKEWRIYKRTKKRRIKKKYRDRFVRRWTEQS